MIKKILRIIAAILILLSLITKGISQDLTANNISIDNTRDRFIQHVYTCQLSAYNVITASDLIEKADFMDKGMTYYKKAIAEFSTLLMLTDKKINKSTINEINNYLDFYVQIFKNEIQANTIETLEKLKKTEIEYKINIVPKLTELK